MFSGSIVVCDKVVSSSLGFSMDAVMRGENGDGEDGSKISGGGDRVEITLPVVCR